MLHLIGLAALAALQVEGQWQDFGTGPDGVGIAVNLDSIERGDAGAEAMLRYRYARAAAGGASQADAHTRFDCAGRTATRLRLVQLDAQGRVVDRPEFGQPMAPVSVASGTPMAQVMELVCSIASS